MYFALQSALNKLFSNTAKRIMLIAKKFIMQHTAKKFTVSLGANLRQFFGKKQIAGAGKPDGRYL